MPFTLEDALLLNRFPGLSRSHFRTTSESTPRYNCIAWAAQETDRFWWPADHAGAFWPAGIAREETIDAFVAAFATKGFAVCSESTLEPGFEKIAFYVDRPNHPTHAARQLADGRWTSKLGRGIDIEHDELESLEGPSAYGTVAVYLKRPVAAPDQATVTKAS